MEEILEKFDTSHQQIHSREEYAEMAKYLSTQRLFEVHNAQVRAPPGLLHYPSLSAGTS